MELPRFKPDLHEALLGPLSLVTEIVGALLPGCVLTILVCVKRGWAASILSYPLLGYRSKLAIGLLASYIAGKVILSIIALTKEIRPWIRRRNKRRKAQGTPPAQASNVLQNLAAYLLQYIEQSPESFQSFLGGLVGAPLLTGKSQTFKHFLVYDAGTVFHLSTGLVFTVCAMIPGDGPWRILEGLVGAILLARGIWSSCREEAIVAGLLGALANEYGSRVQPGQLSSGLKTIWTALTTLANTSVPPNVAQPGTVPQNSESKSAAARAAASSESKN